MDLDLTIHKSQGITLPKSTIDIGLIERQGLTFTTISIFHSLQGLRVSLALSFDWLKRMKENFHTIWRKQEEALLCSTILLKKPPLVFSFAMPSYKFWITNWNMIFISHFDPCSRPCNYDLFAWDISHICCGNKHVSIYMYKALHFPLTCCAQYIHLSWPLCGLAVTISSVVWKILGYLLMVSSFGLIGLWNLSLEV